MFIEIFIQTLEISSLVGKKISILSKFALLINDQETGFGTGTAGLEAQVRIINFRASLCTFLRKLKLFFSLIYYYAGRKHDTS